MKKLFNTGSLITIDEFSSLQVTGPYALITLGPNFATIRSGDYIIEALGEELVVDILAEEVAVFSFDSITKITIESIENEGTRYD